MKKRSQVEILRKRIVWAPNGSLTHDLPDTGWMSNRLFVSTCISTWERFLIIYTLSKSSIKYVLVWGRKFLLVSANFKTFVEKQPPVSKLNS